MSQQGAVSGTPNSRIVPGKLDNGKNPEVTITVPARIPYSADSLPKEINGVKVVPHEMPEPQIKYYTRSQLDRMTKEERELEEADIDLARSHNLIVDDITPRELVAAREKSARESAAKMQKALKIQHLKGDVDKALKAHLDAKAELEAAERAGDPYAALGPQQRVFDTSQAFDTVNAELKTLQSEAQG